MPQAKLEGQISGYIQNLPDADEADSEGILNAIEVQHGLFVERAKGIYSFSHLTFQEYFTARYIVDNAEEGAVQQLVRNHLPDERWREVFLLVASLLPNADSFFLAMRKQISSTVSEQTIAFLTQCAQLVKLNTPFSIPASIALASWYVLTLDQDRDLTLARARARDRARALIQMNELADYLIATKLLADCLNTECYVTKQTRQELLDGLLIEP